MLPILCPSLRAGSARFAGSTASIAGRSGLTRPSGLTSLALVVSSVLGCGDGTDPAGPPNVAGRYQRNDVVPAVTCTPQPPPAGGGTVILDAFTQSFEVVIQQAGTRITMTYPEFPGSPPDTGSVDQSGKVTFGFRETFQEDPRTGNRIFFVDLTATAAVQRTDGGARLTGTGSYVNVFHEGSPTAPVFATCSRTTTVELTRTGG